MINFVESAISHVVENKSDYILDNVHFKRNRKWPFPTFIRFMIFRKRTTLRHSINSMYKLLGQFGFKKVSSSDFFTTETIY